MKGIKYDIFALIYNERSAYTNLQLEPVHTAHSSKSNFQQEVVYTERDSKIGISSAPKPPGIEDRKLVRID